MNPLTGRIVLVDGSVSSGALERIAALGFTPINEEQMTEKQRAELLVSPHDHRSELGRICTEARAKARSKYTPHVGAKQLGKVKK